jgi:predicted RNA binding protein YcfA (HicA-like mRNA interferase family)
MESAGFKMHCQGGSHHTFEYTDGFKVKVSKTHPQGILKKYQIDDVIEGLRRVGYLE